MEIDCEDSVEGKLMRDNGGEFTSSAHITAFPGDPNFLVSFVLKFFTAQVADHSVLVCCILSWPRSSTVLLQTRSCPSLSPTNTSTLDSPQAGIHGWSLFRLVFLLVIPVPGTSAHRLDSSLYEIVSPGCHGPRQSSIRETCMPLYYTALLWASPPTGGPALRGQVLLSTTPDT